MTASSPRELLSLVKASERKTRAASGRGARKEGDRQRNTSLVSYYCYNMSSCKLLVLLLTGLFCLLRTPIFAWQFEAAGEGERTS